MPFLQRYCTSRHHSDSAVILLNISVFISVWVLATAVLFAVASTVSDCSFTVPIFYFCSQQGRFSGAGAGAAAGGVAGAFVGGGGWDQIWWHILKISTYMVFHSCIFRRA